MSLALRAAAGGDRVPMVVARPCPVRHGHDARVLHRQRYALFDDSHLPRETTIVACRACGVVHAASSASAADYRQHSARHSKYDTAVQASGSGEAPADRRRLDDLVRLLVSAVPGLASRDAAILDVGAGRGGLLAAFRRHGYERVHGIDPSPGCVAAMRAAGTAADLGELEQPAWPTDPRCHDLVVLSHVLEHVFDAFDVLQRVAVRVAAGGSIYLEVPDASRYTTDGFPPFYFFDPEHINHFDANALERLAARCGWQVVAEWTRTLEVGADQRYPAIGVVLQRRSVGADAPRAASSIATLASRMQRYVEHSVVTASAGDAPTSKALMIRRTPVVLWGAGSHAQRLLAQGALGQCAIDCIIDSDPGKQGRRLDGHIVVAPADGLERATTCNATVVVAIAVDADRVVDRLRLERPALALVRL